MEMVAKQTAQKHGKNSFSNEILVFVWVEYRINNKNNFEFKTNSFPPNIILSKATTCKKCCFNCYKWKTHAYIKNMIVFYDRNVWWRGSVMERGCIRHCEVASWKKANIQNLLVSNTIYVVKFEPLMGN